MNTNTQKPDHRSCPFFPRPSASARTVLLSGLAGVLGMSLVLVIWNQFGLNSNEVNTTLAASNCDRGGADTNIESPLENKHGSNLDPELNAAPRENPSVQQLSFDRSDVAQASPAQASPDQAGFDREKILDDSENRISDAFSIPKGLRDRAGFWFDVYSKYDENDRIIHHARYPWIIYKVVNVSEIINAKTPSRRWMRNLKAEKLVDSEAKKIRAAIVSVSRRRHLNRLNAYEKAVVTALGDLGGKAQKQARAAIGETRVQVGQKNFFEAGLRISPRYLPTMERIFAARDLPIELTRLPFVESSFNKAATSKDGAAGIWQFVGNTGRKFMIINDQIDERRSPFKATDAAARLLKENHMILYRSWPLALTAYNHGPGGVRKAVRAMGTKDLAKIVDKYRTRNFSFASSNFYCEFLGALHAQMYNDVIWSGLEKEPSLDTHYVRLPHSYRPQKLMKLTGLTPEQILLYNPDLNAAVKRNRVIPSGFRLYVPSQIHAKMERLLAQGESDRRARKSKG